jgi:hypothetical protein
LRIHQLIQVSLLILLGLFVLGTATPGTASTALAGERCLDCHLEASRGHITAHRFGKAPCTTCHAGDGQAALVEDAHEGLIAFPGNLDNAARTCGNCHAGQLAGVVESPMHRGHGMVRITREVMGEPTEGDRSNDLQSLGHGPADSLLRKLCASCHLGQRKQRHALDVTRDRGGGCLACHVNAYPEDAHPRIDAQVEDGRCFGCHSRSGRISLSYPGLVETTAQETTGAGHYARLMDGRLVQHTAADAHQRAGLACIDCHTGRGLMGQIRVEADGTDIACSDCHANTNSRITRADCPQGQQAAPTHISFAVTPDQPFLTTRHGTPLWHIEVTENGLRLHLKLQDRRVMIPQIDTDHFPLPEAHEHLSCDACHSQWAPQCHGCHLTYDRSERQWDHAERAFSPGTWRERRWGVRHGAPTLGINGEAQVVPVVPGMIMTIEHPDWEAPRFVRHFAALSPHTTGPARSCESCHRSSMAVGLGSGRLEVDAAKVSFQPALPPGPDGLPADAWTTLSSPAPSAPGMTVRPFAPAEIRRVLGAPLDGQD